jgi:hypothetical protein
MPSVYAGAVIIMLAGAAAAIANRAAAAVLHAGAATSMHASIVARSAVASCVRPSAGVRHAWWIGTSMLLIVTTQCCCDAAAGHDALRQDQVADRQV